MKKIFFNTAIIAFTVITVVACKKHKEDDHTDDHGTTPVTATISVTTLNEGDTIQSGEMMHISGTITSNAEMHGYQLLIHNHNTMTDVHTTEAHEHAATYSFDEHWTNNVSDTSNMMLKITAVKDHDGNQEIKTINFVCLP